MIITMTLGGLWHGASWTFVIWGVLHGIGLGCVHFLRDALTRAGIKQWPRWLNVLALLFTFHFVTLLWVFFRHRPWTGPARSSAHETRIDRLRVRRAVFHGPIFGSPPKATKPRAGRNCRNMPNAHRAEITLALPPASGRLRCFGSRQRLHLRQCRESGRDDICELPF
jgi:hypothetical protein